jgi:hypothetical protein
MVRNENWEGYMDIKGKIYLKLDVKMAHDVKRRKTTATF